MRSPLTQRHAFLSYMREDKLEVDELQEALEAAGVQVWRDTKDLWPGEDWENKIRAAIRADSLAFLACFSKVAEVRDRSYQYEELTIAVDEYRLRRPNSSWLFTVRFDDCAIPEFDLGGGRSLETTINRTDLFGPGKTVQMVRLSQAVARIMNPPSSPSVTTEVVTEAKRATSDGRSRADTMKQLLRDPSADILLEDFLASIGTPISEELASDELFATSVEDASWGPFSTLWIEQVRRYEKAIEPAVDLVRLASMYGQPQHNQAWERFMRHFTSHIQRDSGTSALLSLRFYPSLFLMYVAMIASTSRGNFAPLHAFVVAPSVRDKYNPQGGSLPIVLVTNVRAVADGAEPVASALAMSDDGREVDTELMDGLVSKKIGNRLTPVSDHLHTVLRDLFRDEIPNDNDYAVTFDRAEILLDALTSDVSAQNDGRGSWAGGYGRYTWRNHHTRNPIEVQMLDELSRQGNTWPPIVDGLFGGSVDRATAAMQHVKETAAQVRSRSW